jgi:hypothetical protein
MKALRRKPPQPTREEQAALYQATIARVEHEVAVIARRKGVIR